MDLMEYQAKELFAKHDVPVTLGTVVEKAEDASAAAEAPMSSLYTQCPHRQIWTNH